jgi:hypothetical protein
MRSQFSWMRNITSVVFAVALTMVLLAIFTGCTVSVGGEARGFYPKEDPRKGFFDNGGIDGLWSRPAYPRNPNEVRHPSSGFNTLGN